MMALELEQGDELNITKKKSSDMLLPLRVLITNRPDFKGIEL